MPRKPITEKELVRMLNDSYRYGGIAECQTKGFTEQEESEELERMFQYVWKAGYQNVHTLRIVPEDGRQPYLVHIDSLNGE
jgi:hypothetical protein